MCPLTSLYTAHAIDPCLTPQQQHVFIIAILDIQFFQRYLKAYKQIIEVELQKFLNGKSVFRSP